MRDFNILTPGEKIKRIRNKFDIKQEDLAGGEITRNLISIIENNKANLTETTAKILTANINRICEEKNIKFSVNEDYLLEGVISQAKKIADEYISYIDGLKNEEINTIAEKLYEIDFFCKSYNAEEKRAELYILIGKKLKLNQQYLKAFDYYLKAFESSSDKTITLKSSLSLGICSMYLSKYEEAINYFNLLLDLGGDRELEYHASFNIALSYQKLGKFEEALDMLNKIIENYNDIISISRRKYIDVYVVMGECLHELKSFNKSIATYKELLKLENLGANELLILSSLSDVYRTTKDFQKLQSITDKMMKKINAKDYNLGSYEGYILLSVAKNIKVIGKENDKAVSLLIESLDYFKSGKSALCFEDTEFIFKELLDIFTENKDDEKVEYLKNELFELIERGSFPRMNTVSLKFIKYYNIKGKTNEIDNLVDFLAG